METAGNTQETETDQIQIFQKRPKKERNAQLINGLGGFLFVNESKMNSCQNGGHIE